MKTSPIIIAVLFVAALAGCHHRREAVSRSAAGAAAFTIPPAGPPVATAPATGAEFTLTDPVRNASLTVRLGMTVREFKAVAKAQGAHFGKAGNHVYGIYGAKLYFERGRLTKVETGQ